MVSSGRFLPALAAAVIVAVPSAALAQSYGTEDLPGGVEAKPGAVPDMSRSMSAPKAAKPAEPDYESAAPVVGAPPDDVPVDAAEPAEGEGSDTNKDKGE